MTQYLLYDTLRSGNAWKVRLLAGYLGLPLARRTLSIDRGDLAQPAFRAIAPLGQVPVLRIDEHTHLPESAAILHYLAQGTPWWPQARLAQARVLSWLAFEQERHMKPLAKLRLHLALRRDRDPGEGEVLRWRTEALDALVLLEAQLQASEWVAGGDVAGIADVALYPYTRLAPMGGIDLSPYPAIVRWLARMEALPGYQPLFAGQPERNFSTTEAEQEQP